MLKDATYLANLIKTKQLSPVEALEDMYSRENQLKDLNAFVELDLEKAKKYYESMPEKFEKRPFYGVPFPLKDVGQSQKGFTESYGSKLFKNHVSSKNNNYSIKINEAGFIPFGVTTAPEYAFKNVTESDLYGVTKNPLDKQHHVGGSSGGAAAVVASGISPIAGASDGGGSIRIPASFTGLIGFKPSRGMIVTGPDDYRSWQGASVNFSLNVSIRDTQTMLSVLKSDTQYGPYNRPVAKLPVVNRSLKIAVCIDSPIGNPVSDEARLAVIEGAKFLEKLGHSVEYVTYPVDGLSVIDSYYQMNGGETANMFYGMESSLGRKLTLTDMELMTWTLFQYGKKLSAADIIQSFTVWDQATATMEKLFETYDLFLSPTATTVAPMISEDLQSDVIRGKMTMAEEMNKLELSELVYSMFEKSLHLTPYTQLANLTGQPAISLPTFVTKNNLPIGIQLMASKGNDRLLLEVGKWFEELKKLYIPNIYKH